jgi:FAD binding domain
LPPQRGVTKNQAYELGLKLFRLSFDLSAELPGICWAIFNPIDLLSQTNRTRYDSPARTNRNGPPMTIPIVGGGIGGLTAALSLHQIGVDCRVFESHSVPLLLGVGINVLPHAVRELTELGLEGAPAETGIPTAELAYYKKHGQRIWSEARASIVA